MEAYIKTLLKISKFANWKNKWVAHLIYFNQLYQENAILLKGNLCRSREQLCSVRRVLFLKKTMCAAWKKAQRCQSSWFQIPLVWLLNSAKLEKAKAISLKILCSCSLHFLNILDINEFSEVSLCKSYGSNALHLVSHRYHHIIS